MYFNAFAPGAEMDLSKTEEFESLLKSASGMGLPVKQPVRYLSRNLVANGLRFHLLEWGEPSLPDLVLLHGGNLSAHTWDLVSLSLADKFHILAVDQRGHGDTEWPRDWDMSNASMVQDIIDLMQALGLQKPMIMGHSMGGRVSMPMLIEQDLASKLVLVDIGPEIGRGGGGEVGQRPAEMPWEFPSIDAYVESVQATDPGRSRERVLLTMPYNLLQRIDGTLVSKTIRRSSATTGYGQAGPRVATLADVHKIRCPVLVIRGEHSTTLMPDAAERLVEALSNGKLITVPKCGHNVHTQNTHGFLEAITPFLDA